MAERLGRAVCGGRVEMNSGYRKGVAIFVLFALVLATPMLRQAALAATSTTVPAPIKGVLWMFDDFEELWNEAAALERAGDNVGAERVYRQAYDLALRVTDTVIAGPYFRGQSCWELGLFFAHMGNPTAAATWLERSAAAFREEDSPRSDWMRVQEAMSLALLGDTYDELGREADARRAYTQGIQTCPTRCDDCDCQRQYTIGWLQNGLAHVTEQRTDRVAALEKAVAALQSAVLCYSGEGEPDSRVRADAARDKLAQSAWALGLYYYDAGDAQRALASYQTALGAVRAAVTPDRCMEITILSDLATAQSELGQRGAVLTTASQAGALVPSANCGSTEFVADEYYALAHSLWDLEEYGQALAWFDRAATLYDSLGIQGGWFSNQLGACDCEIRRDLRAGIQCLENKILSTLSRRGLTGKTSSVLEWLTDYRCELAGKLRTTGALTIATSCITVGVSDKNCPVGERRCFSTSEEKLYVWVALDGDLSQPHSLRYEFISPSGAVYHSGSAEKVWPINWYWLAIKGYPCAGMPGTWKVRIYVDDPFGFAPPRAELTFELRTSCP
jgi:tetratricopeptide (TPR) repeat protein